MNTIIIIQLLLAHILVDFVFQNQKSISDKNTKELKSYHFWVHVLLSGLITYLILQQWSNWFIPLLIIVTHGLIDYWKIKKEKKIAEWNKSNPEPKDHKSVTACFFIDQALHILAIIISWLFLINAFDKVIPFIQTTLTDLKSISIGTALILITWPVGIIIGKITEPFRKELDQSDSLNKAGQYIGAFERLLVFTFILIGQYPAIGFLIASKSILRITRDGADDARKKTEYVLIGTLISFTMATAVGLLVQYLIKT